jgi:peptide/nickel transport system ATP-binding protein
VDINAALAAATGVTLEDVDEAELIRRERENAEALAQAEAEAAKVAGTPALELSGVAIDYPKQGRVPAFRAVEGASLSIYPGQVLGLVGESGSGKTTIGRAAVGLLPVAAGSLKVAGHEIAGANRRQLQSLRRQVGMVFQDPSSSLNPRLPIGESIGEPIHLAGTAKGAALQHRIETLLDQVELPRSYRNRYPHELSGGQKQRVGIARALALQPPLMVADEPTSALDVSVQAKVLELFRNLQRELGFACLFVTHDLAVIDVLADRICVMQRGRIVEQGTRDEILRNPQEPYTQRLLAAVPLPDPDKQRERRELRAQLLASGIE